MGARDREGIRPESSCATITGLCTDISASSLLPYADQLRLELGKFGVGGRCSDLRI